MNTNKNKHIRILILILGSFIGSHLLFIMFSGVFDTLDLRVRDYAFQVRYQLFGRGKVYNHLVHVDINDSTFQVIKPHEWDYSIDARVVNALTELNVGAIAYDMLFSDPSEAEENQDLIDAVSGSKRVYFPMVLGFGDNRGRPVSPQTAYNEEEFMKDQVWKLKVSRGGKPLSASGIKILPFPELRGHGAGIGHINAYPDRDGVYRRLPLFIRYNDGYVPSLTFRMVCDYVQVAASNIEVFFGQHIILHDAKMPYQKKEDIIIPIDEQGNMIVNFAGPWGDSFDHFNYAELLNVSDDNERLGRIRDVMDGDLVLVANVSTGFMDIGNSPIETLYPLCGIHTNVANTILTKDFLYELSIWKQIAIDTSLMALIIFVALRFGTLNFSFIIILVLMAFLAFASYLFFYHNILTNIVRPYIGLQLSLIMVNIYSYIYERQEKALIRHRFECYFAPSTLNKILRSRKRLEMSEKKVLTIIFSDISSFTLWSETQTPEEVRSTLNEYFEEMSKIVFKYEGTIDKYIGDGLMAFYGDPFKMEDQTLCAVKTAIEMQQKTRELKRRWQSQGRLPIKIRIGINRGEVVVGNMGFERRMDYTVIGSAVNIAQRLEAKAPVEGILISEAVQREVKGLVNTKFNGKVALKGIEEELDVYEVKLV
ncbi:hypothetical protein CMO92_05325 [Candidatus Woesearchaeota archaeon]|nr:hypothetical protein [Candidatus Woesearchaeota archaeon]